ncbi:unnamed protein product [Bursaphelenchus okinawaensis]|nr:unnamed protein product [Bursaphelenchus okinawaensis]CAG9118069.1 unnamed protein product [Bursaphelenchus okinawaensis]
MVDLENATQFYYNQTTIVFTDMVNDPCVRNGNSTVPAIIAFVLGLIVYPLLKCVCVSVCQRTRRRAQKRYLRGRAMGRDQADLNKLIDQAVQDNSDLDL